MYQLSELGRMEAMGEPRSKRIADLRDDPRNGAWRLFLDVMLAHKERFSAALAKFDLSPPQAFLLRSLAPGAEIRMCHIASALSCDASNVTNLVDRLESRGLIERQSDPADRRIRNIVLTKAGAKLRTQMLQEAFAPPESLSALTPAELSTFESLLSRVLKAHQASEPDACAE